MVIDMAAQGLEIALPERLQDHSIRRLGAIEKAGDVKAGIRRENCADARPGGRNEGHVARFGGRRLNDRWVCNGGRGPGVGIRWLEDWLLLVPSAFAKHGVKTEPDEQSHQGKNDDDGQIGVLRFKSTNIVRLS